MGSGTSDWSGWCEETAVSTALEVATVIRTNYGLPASTTSSMPNGGSSSEPTNNATATATTTTTSSTHLSTAQANDLVRRFVEVFSRRLEAEILQKAGTPSSAAEPTAQNISYDPASNYSQRNSNGTAPPPPPPNTNSTALPHQQVGNGETPTSNGFHSNSQQQKQTTSPDNTPGRSASGTETEATPTPQQPSVRKPFYRRLSFKGFKKGRFFHKQCSDESTQQQVSGSSDGRSKHDKNAKGKLAKILVECQKEGIVHYLSGENLDGTQKWEKCRLCLVKTVGGYMLEFYSPPKAVKPKSGVFCFLISEARETTALEMPDRENTFVLKAENNMEYVIEAYDTEDMRSWLTIIKYSMRAPTESGEPARNNAQASSHHQHTNGSLTENGNVVGGEEGQQGQQQQQQQASSGNASYAPPANPPQLPPRFPVGSGSEEQQAQESNASNSKFLKYNFFTYSFHFNLLIDNFC